MKVEVIRTNGNREEHDIKAQNSTERFAALRQLVGCDTFDFVNLHDGRVMGVDDNGCRARKPINDEATKIYHAVCRPGTTHQIVGDVVICMDEDFA